MKALRSAGSQHAVAEIELGAHVLEPVQVEVDRPRPEVVTTGQCDAGFAGAGEERAEDEDGRAHLTHQVERRLGVRLFRYVDLERRTRAPAFRTDVVQDAAHDLDVENAGDVGEGVCSRREQSGHHVLEGGVLRAVDAHLAVEAVAADYANCFGLFGHRLPLP